MSPRNSCICDLCQSVGAGPSPDSGLWLCDDCHEEYYAKPFPSSVPAVIVSTVISLLCWVGGFLFLLWLYEFIKRAMEATL